MTIPVTIRLDAPTPRQAYSRGGLARAARQVRKAGRHGDDMVIHVNRDEYDHMVKEYGSPTINPSTGLPEFFLGGVLKAVEKVLGKVAPIALPVLSAVFPGIGGAIGGALGLSGPTANAVGSALLGAGVGGLTNGVKGAVTGSLTSGAVSALAPLITNTLSGFAPETMSSMGINGGSPTIFDSSSSGTGASLFGPSASPSVAASMAPGSLMTGSDYGTQQAGTSGNPMLDSFGVGNVGSGGAGVAASAPGGAGGSSWFGRNLPLLIGGASALNALTGGPKQPKPPNNTVDAGPLNVPNFQRTAAAPSSQDWYTYGERPEYMFFTDNQLPTTDDSSDDDTDDKDKNKNKLAAARGAYVRGPGDGRADVIPASLSNNEYVMDAETVSMLGNGSPDAGAKKLDEMRTNIRKHKGRALAAGKFSPNAKSPLAYLRGGMA